MLVRNASGVEVGGIGGIGLTGKAPRHVVAAADGFGSAAGIGCAAAAASCCRLSAERPYVARDGLLKRFHCVLGTEDTDAAGFKASGCLGAEVGMGFSCWRREVGMGLESGA